MRPRATDVILVGASGLAREVIAAAGEQIHVVGILDDDPARHGTQVDGIDVLGSIADAACFRAQFLICVGSGEGRRAIVARLADVSISDDRFASFIDRSVRVPVGCAVLSGSILLAGVVLTAAVTIGRHCVVMPHVTLTHDDTLHDFVTIAAGAALAGGVTVSEGAYLGMNVSIRQGVTIGPDTMIGMGAVVLSDVPRGETWAGVPASQLEVSA